MAAMEESGPMVPMVSTGVEVWTETQVETQAMVALVHRGALEALAVMVAMAWAPEE